MYAPGLNSLEPEIRVTTNSGNDQYPKIYNDIIVYQSNRNGNWDIYMTTVVVAVAGPTSTNIPRLGAAGPGGTQNESEDFSLKSSEIATIAVTVAVIILVTLLVYYKKQERNARKEKHGENAKTVSTKRASMKGDN